MELKVGDTVRLKSGGPLMTIESIEDKKAFCNWFSNDELKNGTFNIETLEKEDENDLGMYSV